MRLSFAIISSCLILSTLLLAQAQPITMTTQTPWIEPEIFATITKDEGEVYVYTGDKPCTPAKPNIRNWEGVVINAPTVARAGKVFFIPICVTYMVPHFYPETPDMLIVATNLRTNQKFTGLAFIEKIWGDEARDPMPPKPEAVLTNEEISELLNSASGAIFASDLFANAKLPPESAEYRVHIERGDMKSNEVIIKVVWEK